MQRMGSGTAAILRAHRAAVGLLAGVTPAVALQGPAAAAAAAAAGPAGGLIQLVGAQPCRWLAAAAHQVQPSSLANLQAQAAKDWSQRPAGTGGQAVLAGRAAAAAAAQQRAGLWTSAASGRAAGSGDNSSSGNGDGDGKVAEPQPSPLSASPSSSTPVAADRGGSAAAAASPAAPAAAAAAAAAATTQQQQQPQQKQQGEQQQQQQQQGEQPPRPVVGVCRRRQVKVGWKKLDFVLRMIRRSRVDDAMAQLAANPKKAATYVMHAVANARNNAIVAGGDPGRLYVDEAFVTKGQHSKRMHFMGRGYSSVQQTRYSHLNVRVAQLAPGDAAAARRLREPPRMVAPLLEREARRGEPRRQRQPAQRWVGAAA